MKKYKLIACEILFREICACAADSRAQIDISFMPKGLHDIGQKAMQAKLQDELDQVESDKYDAILLCYGLCNNGIAGLTAPIPLVVPRAHDCITLLLGSKERYRSYFDQNPGTFFHSPGWIERDNGGGSSQLQVGKTLADYAALYGEENAEYLYEMCEGWMQNYSRLAYIDTGVGPVEEYRAFARARTQQRQWSFEELSGSLGLFRQLLNGEWKPEDFLVVEPGHTPAPSYRDDVIIAIPV